jgi:hypothetical protein
VVSYGQELAEYIRSENPLNKIPKRLIKKLIISGKTATVNEEYK